ncbi:hypothetical protein DL93DRAFT_2171840 [Clavulina sp. PMI_390]|nr:hypothetical protein DL93DRAFT_2171840 [Clavulina sp. PMI_390]
MASFPLSNTLLIPLYISVLSAIIILRAFFIVGVSQWKSTRRPIQILPGFTAGPTGNENTPHHESYSTGRTTRLLEATRTIALILLVGLSIAALVVERKSPEHHDRWKFELGQSLVFAYTLIISLFTPVHPFVSSPLGAVSLRHHRGLILLSAVMVFSYRDVWPLATFNQLPADAHLGWIGTARVVLVWWAGVIVPFSLPGIYTPVDPKNPTTPNQEQLSSLWSNLVFGFVDPLVWTGFKHAHLPYEKLPPLADDDHSAYIREKSFHLLDPLRRKSRSHIGWALLGFYRRYAGIMVTIVSVQCLMHFLPAIIVFNLLQYTEYEGAGATIRPWFWIFALIVRGVAKSILEHRYLYLMTKIRIQLEGIITEVVFEHALRIRMNDGSSSVSNALTSTADSLTTQSNPSGADANPDTAVSVDQGSNVPTTAPESATMKAPMTEPFSGTSRATPTVAAPSPGKRPNDNAKDDKKHSHLIGKINNLMSSDLQNIMELAEIPMTVVYNPLRIMISVLFLYRLLGWSFFVGFGLMLFGAFVPGRLTPLMHQTQKARSKQTDARVQSISETIGLLRLIKMCGWEAQIEARISSLREMELSSIRRMFLLNLVNDQFSLIFPLITLLVAYFVFAQVMKQALPPSVIFTSLSVMDSLRLSISNLMWATPALITGKVSLDRVNDFIQNTELLDEYQGILDASLIPSAPTDATQLNEIGFHKAQFTWSADDSVGSGSSTPGTSSLDSIYRRRFALRIQEDLLFQQGGLNIIIGPTGCGKTSVLLSLLGEMHFIPGEVGAWFNLPRAGGVSFCPQESWVLNETIRVIRNPLHNETDFLSSTQSIEWDHRITYCLGNHMMRLDITKLSMSVLWNRTYPSSSRFQAGDRTEVGERGLTLSGGQKARVSLARAVYSKSQVVLLDDILAALDVHTARWVVEKCLSGTLLRDRTVILVTHSIPLVAKLVRRTIAVSSSGYVTVQAPNVIVPNTEEELDEKQIAPPKTPVSKSVSGKLIADEEVVFGSVSYSALGLFFKAMGGWSFWALYLGLASIVELLNIFQIWWLGSWGEQYEAHSPQQVNVLYYLGIFALVVLVVTLTFSLSQVVWVHGSMKASRYMHAALSKSILRATLRFLDRTPVGRMLQRFTQDIRSVDGMLSLRSNNFIRFTFMLVGKLLAILFITPQFTLPAIFFGVTGVVVGEMYMKTQMPVKREMSLARAPVFSHFTASIHGLTSIRAYGAQERFIQESMRRIDRYSRVARPFWNLNRWIGLRMDVIGTVFSSLLAAYLVLLTKTKASVIGFQLNLSFVLTEVFFYWVRLSNHVQLEGNSVERIEQYINIEQEPQSTTAGTPPASWPTSAKLRVEKLSARYSPSGVQVLHSISFNCESGEKIGIVGRTGSGKSSLALALLRLIPTEGAVFYDEIPTTTLNLDALRSNITIIPQQPELMSGTIRQNLDPFAEHDDAELNDALRASGLTSLQEDLPAEERITLDTAVGASGGNFSVGQRQIIALARALVRHSKILILDEATASMDHTTDALIQTSLRTRFRDCTVLTIAHRLQTIMDSDKILVLESGKLVEFDSPIDLLAREESVFRDMVDGSGDREVLRALAGASNGRGKAI